MMTMEDRQTKYMYLVTLIKEGSTKIVIDFTPGAGVFVRGRGHLSHIVNMHYILFYHIQHTGCY